MRTLSEPSRRTMTGINVSPDRFFGLLFAAAAGVLLNASACAQNYPNRIVRIIVPFAPGGPLPIFRLAFNIGN